MSKLTKTHVNVTHQDIYPSIFCPSEVLKYCIKFVLNCIKFVGKEFSQIPAAISMEQRGGEP